MDNTRQHKEDWHGFPRRRHEVQVVARMTDPTLPGRYEIRVSGTLDQRWSRWFEDLEIAHRGFDTVISGRLPDQAALHGLLNKVRDLDLFLISVLYLGIAERQPEPQDRTRTP